MDEAKEVPCGKIYTHSSHIWRDKGIPKRCHGAFQGKLNYHPDTDPLKVLEMDAKRCPSERPHPAHRWWFPPNAVEAPEYWCLGNEQQEIKVEEPVKISAREFAERVADRIKWIEEHCPEVLDRPVMIVSEETADQASDVFVEEFLCIRIP